MDQIYPIGAYIAALAAATERGVEIIKGFSERLSTPRPTPDLERRRKQVLQVIAVGVGILTAILASPVTDKIVVSDSGALIRWGWPGIFFTIVLGLLAGGGSGLWNATLLYLKAVKDTKVSKVSALPHRPQAE